MVKKNGTELEELKKENDELKKRLAELESLLNDGNEEEDEKLQEIENPYTVTNRAIDELVSPKDTMFYLSVHHFPFSILLIQFHFS